MKKKKVVRMIGEIEIGIENLMLERRAVGRECDEDLMEALDIVERAGGKALGLKHGRKGKGGGKMKKSRMLDEEEVRELMGKRSSMSQSAAEAIRSNGFGILRREKFRRVIIGTAVEELARGSNGTCARVHYLASDGVLAEKIFMGCESYDVLGNLYRLQYR